MKKHFLIALFILSAISYSSQSAAVILHPTADAPTYAGYPDTNFDNYYHPYYSDLDRELWTGTFWGSWNSRSYLKFDLSEIPMAASARFWFYNGVAPGGKGSSYAPADVAAYSASINWREISITWNNQPSLGLLADTVTVGTDAGWYSWDVTSLAQSANGSILSLALASDGAGHVYYARETSSGLGPYLDVVVAEPSTLISFSSFIFFIVRNVRRQKKPS